jgi:hypothetical protein
MAYRVTGQPRPPAHRYGGSPFRTAKAVSTLASGRAPLRQPCAGGQVGFGRPLNKGWRRPSPQQARQQRPLFPKT